VAKHHCEILSSDDLLWSTAGASEHHTCAKASVSGRYSIPDGRILSIAQRRGMRSSISTPEIEVHINWSLSFALIVFGWSIEPNQGYSAESGNRSDADSKRCWRMESTMECNVCRDFQGIHKAVSNSRGGREATVCELSRCRNTSTLDLGKSEMANHCTAVAISSYVAVYVWIAPSSVRSGREKQLIAALRYVHRQLAKSTCLTASSARVHVRDEIAVMGMRTVAY
jgi:hypothetical protein